MSYVEQTLRPDETITYKARYHWFYTLFAVLFLTVGFITLILPIIGLVMLINKATTEMIVTSRRFVYKTGWISRRTEEISLGKLEEINLQQSILGRILGYGKLRLSGTGVGQIMLPTIDDPLGLRRAIDAAKAAI